MNKTNNTDAIGPVIIQEILSRKYALNYFPLLQHPYDAYQYN